VGRVAWAVFLAAWVFFFARWAWTLDENRPQFVQPANDLVRYVTDHGLSPADTRLLVASDFGMQWIGGFVVYDPIRPPFARDFLAATEDGDYVDLCKAYDIDVVVSNPVNRRWSEGLERAMEADPAHFLPIPELTFTCTEGGRELTYRFWWFAPERPPDT
jgi:hypothetical protein